MICKIYDHIIISDIGSPIFPVVILTLTVGIGYRGYFLDHILRFFLLPLFLKAFDLVRENHEKKINFMQNPQFAPLLSVRNQKSTSTDISKSVASVL